MIDGSVKVLSIVILSLLLLATASPVVAQSSGGGDDIFAEIREEAKAIGSVRSLLIQQKGKRIAEQYYHSMEAGRKMNIKSASKSIISLLVGIAIDEGIIDGVDERIAQYFEDISNPKKRKITIKDLLTMRSGLETTSFDNYGAWVTSGDWVEYVLEQPMVKELGGAWAYSTGSTHLLSVILTKASGMSTRTFADKYLFEPLNIEPGGWDRGPQGYYMGGNNLALSSEAMMKIGQLVLSGGLWNGQRIVPEWWLKDALQTYTRSTYNPYNYGYLWWNRPVAGHKAYFAWGYGGQYIFLIPDLDAVVIILSSLNTATQGREYKEPVFRLLRQFIIPKVLENDSG